MASPRFDPEVTTTCGCCGTLFSLLDFHEIPLPVKLLRLRLKDDVNVFIRRSTIRPETEVLFKYIKMIFLPQHACG